MKKLKFPDGREGISCGSIWEIPEGRGSYENPFRVEYEYFLELHIDYLLLVDKYLFNVSG